MRAIVMCAIVALLLAGCGSKHEVASTCPAPKLVPQHLPAGLRRVRSRPFVQSGWAMTWRSRTATVQVAGAVNANLGDVPGSATVRGNRANYGETGIAAAPLAIQWTERVRCGKRTVEVPYSVLVRGVDAKGMVRVAQSLRAP